MSDNYIMYKSLKLFPVLTLLISLNAHAQNAAFTSPDYNEESSDPLHEGEMTVIHEYPNHPCGTLMTEFSKPGSVRLGRGPVYKEMETKCLELDPAAKPNDFSVRTYACENIQKGNRILAKATFSFECGDGTPGSRCTPTQMKGVSKKSWNCLGIAKRR